METSRMVRSRFWKDSFIQGKLNPLDRYLFLYLITNDKTNISGIYEIPMKFIAMETGLDISELERSMFPRLSEKIEYFDGWVIIKNFQKHQNLKSASIKTAIFKELSKVSEKVLKQAISIGYIDGVYTVSTPSREVQEQVQVQVQVKEQVQGEGNKKNPHTLQEKSDLFFHEVEEFAEGIDLTESNKMELRKFISYWTEPNTQKTKLRWEMEKTWDLGRRIARWMSNNSFSGQKVINKIIKV